MHNAIVTAAMLASLYTTPNGAVIDWYGNVVAPAPQVQVISVPKPIKSAAPAVLPIVKPTQIFKPLNDFCWYNAGPKDFFSVACGG